MVSLERFKKKTIHIPFLLFLLVSIFYVLGERFGFFKLDLILYKMEIVFILISFFSFIFYKKRLISYKVLSYVLIIGIFFVINMIFFCNKNVIYRSFWFVAIIPFVFLYGNKRLGILFTLYIVIVMFFAYKQGLFKITFQDYVSFLISVIMISSVTYFFITQMEKFEKQVKSEQKRLNIQAKTDYLTNIYNRRGFMEAIKDEKGVIGVFDLDYFKKINDTYGHEFGDKYLKHFVSLLHSSIRKDDIIGRFGGDEFVVLFKNAKKSELHRWIRNFYKKLEKNRFKGLKISVSVGFANYDGDIKESFNLADNALYISKTKRNRFTFFEE